MNMNMAIKMSRIDAEEKNSGAAASYQITVAFAPSRLTPEVKRALAEVMRRHAREMQLTVQMVASDARASTALTYTSSGTGHGLCDISETLEVEE